MSYEGRDLVESLCARAILALVLIILVFGPLALGAVDTGTFLFIEWLTLAILGLWGVRMWTSRRFRLF